MKVDGTSDDSRRSSRVRYPFSTSHLRPAVVGALPPASLTSTATKRAIPGPTLADGEGSGSGTVADVRSSSRAAAGGGSRWISAGFLASSAGLAAGPAAGAAGDGAVDLVTSPGRSRGGR